MNSSGHPTAVVENEFLSTFAAERRETSSGKCRLNVLSFRGGQMDQFLPADAVTGEEWMALRSLSFGVPGERIPAALRERLESIGLIERGPKGFVITERGRGVLSLY